MAQPADNSSIPQVSFDPNSADNSAFVENANAPLGNLLMQDSEGFKGDVEVGEDDFDYEDV